MDNKRRFEELKKQLEYHSKLYEEGCPEISDSEYDDLYFEFSKLMEEMGIEDDKNPVTTPTGVFSEELKKVKHKGFVGSLSKVKTYDGIKKWLEYVEDFAKNNGYSLPVQISCQYKYDGLTIVAEYKDGKLVSALTRGDGEYGENVLNTVLTIGNLPRIILGKSYLRIRFEAEIDNKDFEAINEKEDFSNARNLVAGTIRQADIKLAAERNIKAHVFEVSEGCDAKNLETEKLSTLKVLGFDVPTSHLYNSNEITKIMNYIDDVEHNVRSSLPFKIDGMVLKVNDVNLAKAMGTRHSNPRGAIAYKFSSLDATTELLSVDWDVGRTGRMSPVATFKPINIDGVVIRKATLHNINYIKARDLHIGDRILVARSNDVIPAVIANVQHNGGTKVSMPTTCPFCGTKLVRRENTYFCPSESCSRRVYKNVLHWCSKGGANIDGLGPAKIAQLMDAGWIKNVADIYELYNHVPELIKMPDWGPDSTIDLIENIDDSRNMTMNDFIRSIGIDGIGDVAAKVLTQKFHTIADIMAANVEDFTKLKGVGKVMGTNIAKFFKENALTVTLLESELNIENPVEEKAGGPSASLYGKVFVITGTLSSVRAEVVKKITAAGGTVKNSVTKNTDYLVVGEAPGTTKVVAARQHGVKTINEKELLEMLG